MKKMTEQMAIKTTSSIATLIVKLTDNTNNGSYIDTIFLNCHGYESQRHKLVKILSCM